MVDDDDTKWLIINEGFVDFTGLGPLGVAVANRGNGGR